MIIANVLVRTSTAETISCENIPKGSIGFEVHFEFEDPVWETLSKTVVFRNSRQSLNSILSDDCAVIPHELLDLVGDKLFVGVYGMDSEQALAIPTVWATLGRIAGAATPAEDTAAEATLPYWAQIQEKVDTLEQEMMTQEDLEAALLQAKESGEFDGPQGIQGIQGIQGAQGVQGEKGDPGDTLDAPAIICNAAGEIIALADAAERELKQLRIFGKTIQDGTPTPDAPVALESIGDSGSIVVSVTDGTAENVQTLTVATPNGLPGIPVSSGGNYTDADGQQWICDEVDFANGVYVQNVGRVVLDGTESWSLLSSGDYSWFGCSVLTDAHIPDYTSLPNAYCTHYPAITRENVILGSAVGFSMMSAVQIIFCFGDGYTVDTVKEELAAQYAAGNPITVLYRQTISTETALTDAELAQYAALHTNYPNTTVYNDGGAGLGLEYAADTKTYIDNKFAELAAAIVANA